MNGPMPAAARDQVGGPFLLGVKPDVGNSSSGPFASQKARDAFCRALSNAIKWAAKSLPLQVGPATPTTMGEVQKQAR